MKQKTAVSSSSDKGKSPGFDLEAVYTILIRAYLDMEMEKLDKLTQSAAIIEEKQTATAVGSPFATNDTFTASSSSRDTTS